MEIDDNKQTREGEVVRKPDDKQKLLAALSYVGILFILPVLLGDKTKFVRLHVRQGVIVCAFEFGTVLFGWIPLFGWSFSLAVLVVAIVAFVRAFRGEEWKIPYVYDWSKQVKL
jgi:uncharacterized membrane protein